MRTKITDHSNTLIYIHIGKCGGASLHSSIINSPRVKEAFASIHKIHIKKPPILKNASYAIVVRNPIKRAISAFNWRFKLVVNDEAQRHRFKGEYEILQKYGTLNTYTQMVFWTVRYRMTSKKFITSKKVFHFIWSRSWKRSPRPKCLPFLRRKLWTKTLFKT